MSKLSAPVVVIEVVYYGTSEASTVLYMTMTQVRDSFNSMNEPNALLDMSDAKCFNIV